MEVTFQTEQELYQHVMPALRAKRMDLKRHQLPYIKEEDIWNYLKRYFQMKRGKFLKRVMKKMIMRMSLTNLICNC